MIAFMSTIGVQVASCSGEESASPLRYVSQGRVGRRIPWLVAARWSLDKPMPPPLRRAVWKVLGSCAVLAAGFLASAELALAAEGESPTIVSTSVTDVTEHGVTLVAQINPPGSETAYELHLVWQDAHPPASGEPVL
jgi:hypothetical protein